LSWCNSERKDNKDTLKEKKNDILKLDGKIDKLNGEINNAGSGLKAQIEGTEKELTENRESQVTETSERTEANVAYQADVKNLVSAEKLIGNAVNVLNAYYEQFDSSFIQEDPAPPKTFGEYAGQSKQAAGKGGAIGMLEFILKETKAEETAAHSGEESAQAKYEDSMTSLKKLQADGEKRMGDLKVALSQAEEDLLGAEEDLKATTKDKDAVKDYLAKIKPGCDFITTNFDERNANRKTESSALAEAKGKLKGSPAYKAAVVDATEEGYGKCKETCVKAVNHVNCKSCMADVTVPAYCAGHKGTAGC